MSNIERMEFEKCKDDLYAKLNVLDRDLGLLKQALDTHKDRMDERYDYNGRNHEAIRADITKVQAQLDAWEGTIEWAKGLQAAARKVVLAVVIAGILGLFGIITKVMTFLQSLQQTTGGGVGGP